MMLGGILKLGQRLTNAVRMTETVEIGTWTEHTDPTSGEPVRVRTRSSYTGGAEVKFPTLVVGEKPVQGQQVATSDTVLKLPAGVAHQVRKNDLVKVTGSTVDGMLVGRWFRVKSLPQSGKVTAHRFPIEEAT